MKHIFFLVLSALAFSCSQTAEKPKNRSLECYVRYLEPEEQIRVEATLREGDTLFQPIRVPEGIRYQSKTMALSTAQGILYRLEDSGDFDSKHLFSWKDEKGVIRQFEMQFSPIQRFGFGSKTLAREKPAIFRWEGAPLTKGETLVFLWENAALNKTVPMEVINNSAAPAIDFPAAKMAELEPGTWIYYLVRKKLTKADANGVAASGIIEYYTKSDTIQVR